MDSQQLSFFVSSLNHHEEKENLYISVYKFSPHLLILLFLTISSTPAI